MIRSVGLSATYLPEKQSKYPIIRDIELRRFLRDPEHIEGESEKGYPKCEDGFWRYKPCNHPRALPGRGEITRIR